MRGKTNTGAKIYFGPLWDYDIAYNNCDRAGDVTNASMIDKGFGDGPPKIETGSQSNVCL